MDNVEREAAEFRDIFQRLRDEVGKVIVGGEGVIEGPRQPRAEVTAALRDRPPTGPEPWRDLYGGVVRSESEFHVGSIRRSGDPGERPGDQFPVDIERRFVPERRCDAGLRGPWSGCFEEDEQASVWHGEAACRPRWIRSRKPIGPRTPVWIQVTKCSGCDRKWRARRVK